MQRIFTTCCFVLLLVFNACLEGSKKQEVQVNTPEEVNEMEAEVPDAFDAEFIDGMTGTLWNYYSEIRLALVNSDAGQAATAAGYLAEAFGGKHRDLKTIAEELGESDDIGDQRRLFRELSRGLEPVFSEALSKGVIYKQYCPMAFENKGAYWLSNIAGVRNPYFGEKMLNCGETTRVIRGDGPN